MSAASLWLIARIAAAEPACVSWGEPALTGTCEAIEVNESSGLAGLSSRPGEWVTHNDAGGAAELYRFDESGALLETHAVDGATFRDWEDLAAGPCPDETGDRCIFIGDIGDNGRTRTEVQVFAVDLPTPGAPVSVRAAWRLAYPGGSADAEALAVHPCTGRVYVFTKQNDDTDPTVWRLPATAGVEVDPTPLEYVATLPQAWLRDSGRITAADWGGGGDRLVIRTYGHAFAWETDPADPAAHWAAAPIEVPIDPEGQGESIAWHPDGGLFTSTEGVPMRLVRVPCGDTVLGATCPDPTEPDTGRDSGGPAADGVDGADGADGTDGTTDGVDDLLDPPGEAGVGFAGPHTRCECGGGGAAGGVFLALGVVARRRRQGAKGHTR